MEETGSVRSADDFFLDDVAVHEMLGNNARHVGGGEIAVGDARFAGADDVEKRLLLAHADAPRGLHGDVLQSPFVQFGEDRLHDLPCARGDAARPHADDDADLALRAGGCEIARLFLDPPKILQTRYFGHGLHLPFAFPQVLLERNPEATTPPEAYASARDLR